MKKRKILLIDDDTDFTEMIKIHLESKNDYEVECLSESKKVMDTLHAFRPDVILLDLLMPGIGGIEVCEMLDKDPLGLSTPVIIISGLNKNVDKLKAYKLGVADYLVKPVDANDIINAVEKALRAKFQQD
jgi:Response regulator containing CheY-like receiver, AAA-type ATPase, and DNA-binding domains